MSYEASSEYPYQWSQCFSAGGGSEGDADGSEAMQVSASSMQVCEIICPAAQSNPER